MHDGFDEELRGSDVRLWKLIEARTRPGADKAAIDQRVWDLFGEEWAIMFTDLAGFSRHVAEFGIVHFLQVIWEQKKLLLPIVADHDGILVKIEADSFLILFRRTERALACAVAMQRACRDYNVSMRPEEQVLLCVGIGFGKILRIGDTDVFGAEVNAASKLGEDRARRDEILITGAARDAIASGQGEGVPSRFAFEPRDVEVPGAERCFEVRYEV